MKNQYYKLISHNPDSRSEEYALMLSVSFRTLINTLFFQHSIQHQVFSQIAFSILSQLFDRQTETVSFDVFTEFSITAKWFMGVQLSESETRYQDASDAGRVALNLFQELNRGLMLSNIMGPVCDAFQQKAFEHIPWILGCGAQFVGATLVEQLVDGAFREFGVSADDRREMGPWVRALADIILAFTPKVASTNEGITYHYPSLEGSMDFFGPDGSWSLRGKALSVSKPVSVVINGIDAKDDHYENGHHVARVVAHTLKGDFSRKFRLIGVQSNHWEADGVELKFSFRGRDGAIHPVLIQSETEEGLPSAFNIVAHQPELESLFMGLFGYQKMATQAMARVPVLGRHIVSQKLPIPPSEMPLWQNVMRDGMLLMASPLLLQLSKLPVAQAQSLRGGKVDRGGNILPDFQFALMAQRAIVVGLVFAVTNRLLRRARDPLTRLFPKMLLGVYLAIESFLFLSGEDKAHSNRVSDLLIKQSNKAGRVSWRSEWLNELISYLKSIDASSASGYAFSTLFSDPLMKSGVSSHLDHSARFTEGIAYPFLLGQVVDEKILMNFIAFAFNAGTGFEGGPEAVSASIVRNMVHQILSKEPLLPTHIRQAVASERESLQVFEKELERFIVRPGWELFGDPTLFASYKGDDYELLGKLTYSPPYQTFLQTVFEEIEALNVGEYRLFPAGFLSQIEAHSAFIIVTRLPHGYYVEVGNTGTGSHIQFSFNTPFGRQYFPVAPIWMSNETLKQFLSDVLIFRFRTPISNPYAELNKKLGIYVHGPVVFRFTDDQFMPDGFHSRELHPSRNYPFIFLQLSGNCWVESIKKALFVRGVNYDRMLYQWMVWQIERQFVLGLAKAIKKESVSAKSVYVPTDRKGLYILQSVCQAFLWRSYAAFKEGYISKEDFEADLDVIQELQSYRDQLALKGRVETLPKWDVDHIVGRQVEEVIDSFSEPERAFFWEFPPVFRNQTDRLRLPFHQKPVWELSDDPLLLKATLNKISDDIEHAKSVGKEAFDDMVLGDLVVVLERFEKPGAPFWKKIPQDQKRACIETLIQIGLYLAKSTSTHFMAKDDAEFLFFTEKHRLLSLVSKVYAIANDLIHHLKAYQDLFEDKLDNALVSDSLAIFDTNPLTAERPYIDPVAQQSYASFFPTLFLNGGRLEHEFNFGTKPVLSVESVEPIYLPETRAYRLFTRFMTQLAETQGKKTVVFRNKPYDTAFLNNRDLFLSWFASDSIDPLLGQLRQLWVAFQALRLPGFYLNDPSEFGSMTAKKTEKNTYLYEAILQNATMHEPIFRSGLLWSSQFFPLVKCDPHAFPQLKHLHSRIIENEAIKAALTQRRTMERRDIEASSLIPTCLGNVKLMLSLQWLSQSMEWVQKKIDLKLPGHILNVYSSIFLFGQLFTIFPPAPGTKDGNPFESGLLAELRENPVFVSTLLTLFKKVLDDISAVGSISSAKTHILLTLVEVLQFLDNAAHAGVDISGKDGDAIQQFTHDLCAQMRSLLAHKDQPASEQWVVTVLGLLATDGIKDDEVTLRYLGIFLGKMIFLQAVDNVSPDVQSRYQPQIKRFIGKNRMRLQSAFKYLDGARKDYFLNQLFEQLLGHAMSRRWTLSMISPDLWISEGSPNYEFDLSRLQCLSDGVPILGLPSEVTRHEEFKRLFPMGIPALFPVRYRVSGESIGVFRNDQYEFVVQLGKGSSSDGNTPLAQQLAIKSNLLIRKKVQLPGASEPEWVEWVPESALRLLYVRWPSYLFDFPIAQPAFYARYERVEPKSRDGKQIYFFPRFKTDPILRLDTTRLDERRYTNTLYQINEEGAVISRPIHATNALNEGRFSVFEQICPQNRMMMIDNRLYLFYFDAHFDLGEDGLFYAVEYPGFFVSESQEIPVHKNGYVPLIGFRNFLRLENKFGVIKILIPNLFFRDDSKRISQDIRFDFPDVIKHKHKLRVFDVDDDGKLNTNVLQDRFFLAYMYSVCLDEGLSISLLKSFDHAYIHSSAVSDIHSKWVHFTYHEKQIYNQNLLFGSPSFDETPYRHHEFKKEFLLDVPHMFEPLNMNAPDSEIQSRDDGFLYQCTHWNSPIFSEGDLDAVQWVSLKDKGKPFKLPTCDFGHIIDRKTKGDRLDLSGILTSFSLDRITSFSNPFSKYKRFIQATRLSFPNREFGLDHRFKPTSAADLFLENHPIAKERLSIAKRGYIDYLSSTKEKTTLVGDWVELKAEMQDAFTKLRVELDGLIQDIVDRLNLVASSVDHVETYLWASTIVNKRNRIGFDDAVSAFMDGRNQAFLDLNPSLSVADIHTLNQRIMEALIVATQKKSLQDVLMMLDLDQTDANREKIAKRLATRRAYSLSSDWVRTLLGFEYILGLTLWPKQLNYIKDMLRTDEYVVRQELTGDGKTTVLPIIVDLLTKKNPDRGVIVITRPSLVDELRHHLMLSFGPIKRPVLSIRYDGNDSPLSLRKLSQKMKWHQAPLLCTLSELQQISVNAMQNPDKMIADMIDGFGEYDANVDEVRAYATSEVQGKQTETFEFLRMVDSANKVIDEVDSVLDPAQIFKIATGFGESYSKMLWKIPLWILRQLLYDNTIGDIIEKSGHSQLEYYDPRKKVGFHLKSIPYYQDHLKPALTRVLKDTFSDAFSSALAESTIQEKDLKKGLDRWLDEHALLLRHFLLSNGPCPSVETLNAHMDSLKLTPAQLRDFEMGLDIFKSTLNTVLPNCLNAVMGKDYGRYYSTSSDKGIQFDSNLILAQPRENTRSLGKDTFFSHPLATVVYTTLEHFTLGLAEDEIIRLFRELANDAFSEIEGSGIVESETEAHHLLMAWVSELPEKERRLLPDTVSVRLLDLKNESQVKLLKKIFGRLPNVVDYFLVRFNGLSKFGNEYFSVASDLAGPVSGGSATLSALPSWYHVVEHATALGQSIYYLTQPVNRPVAVIDAVTEDALLDYFVAHVSEHRVLIDSGGIIKRSPEDVSRRLLEKAGAPFKRIVFIQETKGQEIPVYIDWLHPKPTPFSGETQETDLVYYPTPYCVGVDIQHQSMTTALVTVTDNNIESIIQAVGRMRQYRELNTEPVLSAGHGIRLCVSTHLKDHILGFFGEPEPRELISDDVLSWLVIRGSKSQEDRLVMSVFQEIESVQRRNALELVINGTDTVSMRDSIERAWRIDTESTLMLMGQGSKVLNTSHVIRSAIKQEATSALIRPKDAERFDSVLRRPDIRLMPSTLEVKDGDELEGQETALVSDVGSIVRVNIKTTAKSTQHLAEYQLSFDQRLSQYVVAATELPLAISDFLMNKDHAIVETAIPLVTLYKSPNMDRVIELEDKVSELSIPTDGFPHLEKLNAGILIQWPCPADDIGPAIERMQFTLVSLSDLSMLEKDFSSFGDRPVALSLLSPFGVEAMAFRRTRSVSSALFSKEDIQRAYLAVKLHFGVISLLPSEYEILKTVLQSAESVSEFRHYIRGRIRTQYQRRVLEGSRLEWFLDQLKVS